MGSYQEIEGDLIKLALEGKFDVIAHGCNCFSRMKRGIAPQMDEAFGCGSFGLERHSGDISKLGCIDAVYNDKYNIHVINAYTQYHWDSKKRQLDYSALGLCLKKINHIFKGKHIGLPQIGCGLAGGDWELVKNLIQIRLKDCNVTVVIYKP